MQFVYKARTKEGELKTGTIETGNKEAAINILQEGKLVIISLETKEKGGGLMSKNIKLFEGVTKKDVMVMARQLSTLFSAKVPILRALQALANQTKNPAFRERLNQIATDVNAGASLSYAFSKHEKVFSPFFINMVKSGETAGKLEEVFLYLADYIERDYYLVSKARSAMIYPAFILISILVVGLLMVGTVIPKLSQVLIESGQALPVLTQIIIALGLFVNKWWWLILITFALFAIFLFRYLKTAGGKEFFDRAILKIPTFGKIFRQIYISRFSNNLSTLVKGGLPIIQAIQITGDVIGNAVYKDIFNKTAENVKVGKSISSVFESYSKDIPPIVTQMISIGEETGKLEEILSKISSFYQKEVDNLVDNLVGLIEPILIVVFGAAVGLLVAGILLPIYNIAGGL